MPFSKALVAWRMLWQKSDSSCGSLKKNVPNSQLYSSPTLALLPESACVVEFCLRSTKESTVLPGLIDTHRHLLMNRALDSDEALARWMDTQLAASLQAYLESGLTTVMSTGDYLPAIMDVRRRLESGDLKGPRLLVAGPVFTASDGHPTVTV